MPERLVATIEAQMNCVRSIHARDLADGFRLASLPAGLATKFQSP